MGAGGSSANGQSAEARAAAAEARRSRRERRAAARKDRVEQQKVASQFTGENATNDAVENMLHGIGVVKTEEKTEGSPIIAEAGDSTAVDAVVAEAKLPWVARLVAATGGDPDTVLEQAQNFTNITESPWAICKQPWNSMNHKNKEDFFAGHPECEYLNECEGSLPLNEGDVVNAVGAGYIRRYSEDTQYTHMAMVNQLSDGRLIAMWQAAPGLGNESAARLAVEGLDMQHIQFSISKDREGMAWLPPQRVPIKQTGALWSPVVHVDRHGHVWLFYSESRMCRKAQPCRPCVAPPCPSSVSPEEDICHTPAPTWVPGGDIKVTMLVGEVEQNSWRPSKTLLTFEAGGGVAKVISNHVVVLQSGTWLLPYWREQAQITLPDQSCPRKEEDGMSGCTILNGDMGACYSGGEESAGVLLSHDEGKSWRPHGRVTHERTKLIEGTAAQLLNGTVVMVFRSATGCLFKSVSHDDGRHWSEATAMPVPNPNSKVHMLSLRPRGELLLAFNNHRSPGLYRGLKNCRACRTKLHLAISQDGGDNWFHVASLDDEHSLSAVRIHYPSMVQLGNTSRVVLVYSRFYLGRKMGLSSLDQGVVAATLDITKALMTKYAHPPPAAFAAPLLG